MTKVLNKRPIAHDPHCYVFQDGDRGNRWYLYFYDQERQSRHRHSLATQAGVAATTVARLARTDDKAASALSLELASRIVTVLDCGIEDLLEIVDKAPTNLPPS